MKQKTNYNINHSSSSSVLQAYFYGLLAAAIIVLLLSLAATLVLHFTTLLDDKTATIQVIISIVAVFSAGIVTAMKAKLKGLYRGLLLGVLYVILLIISNHIQGIEMTSDAAIKSLLYILAGGLGGLTGITLYRKKHEA